MRTICKKCMVVEYHLVAAPGPIAGTFRIGNVVKAN